MLNWKSVSRTRILLLKNIKMYKICKNVKIYTAKEDFCKNVVNMNKWGKRQWKLNQQDFLEGEGAREKHKKEIHLDGVRQVLLF